MVEAFCDRLRDAPCREVRITARALFVWVLVSIVVSGFHLSLFAPAFRETWYAPLHFLWVVAISSTVAWLCLRSRGTGRGSLLQAALLLVVSGALSWAVTRVAWGVGIVGETRLPLGGAFLVFASLLLLAVSILAPGNSRKLPDEIPSQ